MNSKLAKLGTVFFILLIVLIFLSKTIYSYNIPTVTAEMPKNGKIKKEDVFSGIVSHKEVLESYFDLSGYVDEIFVSEGDKVKKGDPLISFRFDEEDLLERQKQLGISQNSINLDIENIKLDIQKTQKYIEDLKNDTYDMDEISLYDLQQLQIKIEKAEEEYTRKEQLYEAGAISETELKDGLFEITSLKNEYENKEKELKDEKEKSEKSYNDKIKDRDRKIEEYNYDLIQLNQDLRAKELEVQKLGIESENIASNYNKLSANGTVYAKEDGVILELPVKKGQYVTGNQMVVSLGAGNEFEVKLNVNLKNNYITLGDECNASNSNMKEKGTVTKLQAQEAYKEVTVTIVSDKLSQGETVDVKFTKESDTTYTLVPNSAVSKDKNGSFVYYIRKRDGILGEEYYLAKVPVITGDSDNSNTAVLSGISFFEPVVTLTDKQVSEGTTVKVKNEGDFFGN